MHRIMNPDGNDDIEEIASDWLVRRQSERWTQADQVQLEQWLEASTLHRVAFLRLELAWEESARLKALGAGIVGDEPPAPGCWNLTPLFDSRRAAALDQTKGNDLDSEAAEPHGARAAGGASTRSASRPRGFHLAMAASVLLAVVAGIGTYGLRSDSSDRYVTPVGGRASVPMLDGSKITLNTNSQLRVALTATERRVNLHQGEAFFEVEKDPQRPFVVEVGNKRVVAIGTKFSVRRDGDDVEVVVTEGKVRVEDRAVLKHGGGVEAAASAPVLLTPGAIARASEGGVLVQRKSVHDAEAHLSWRVGVLMFRDQSLAGVAAELNRYNVRQIVIADPEAGALKVEGNFTATNLDAFVRLIESGFPVRASLEEGQIIISSR